MKNINNVKSVSQKTNARRGRRPSLRKVRETLNLNQCEMAEVLDITQAMVSMVESGKAKAGRKLLRRIGEVAEQISAAA
jgi:predicted transcriptional regulator